ncbi:MAG TPA: prefoldin subunit beta [Candidatus Methanoculleus thermohydrogenotrophicum]|nr:prefoldin subunit beta [Candidatus Methanoculleus thermohydrogenotrophicum]NLM82307.1 prefoldin subunit beta [Candidatus Methanoculleus thermohydrogenotrophicum]HOB18388.1 prefoldin subunit beta [Candidatus Methanoculleus thermohydrogenotrophicum]HPZ38494.1 prefoldin subunit beta [Candidatus Methanoculleus thermohydrogenotrophicum]
MENIPPRVQNQLAMLQQVQQQLQTVITQKTQYELTIREARQAVEDLSDVPEDAAVFMSVGSVMMQKSKEQVLASLNERIETLELRVKSLEKQEKALRGRFEQLSAQIRGALEGKQQPPGTT